MNKVSFWVYEYDLKKDCHSLKPAEFMAPKLNSVTNSVELS